MKSFIFIALVCYLAFAPGHHTQFVLDDDYTVIHNPLIKKPALYSKILTSNLFDAYHQGLGYIWVPYYRPVLEASYILDYRLFQLNPIGYQWMNWFIHLFNGWLVFILIGMLFKDSWLAFLTASFFVVMPSHEWVVRYVTGRGDSLQTFFGLIFLISLTWSFETKKVMGYVGAFLALVLSIFSREFGYLLPLYGGLVAYVYFRKNCSILFFSLWWIAIGSLSLFVTWHLLDKLGPIQSQHFWYFISIGCCLVFSFLLLRFRSGKVLGILLMLFLMFVSSSQKPYWSSEETLMRYTHRMENRPFTVCHQQLLLKYDEDIESIIKFINVDKRPLIRSVWFLRLAQIAYNHKELPQALVFVNLSLKFNPTNLVALNTKAVVLLESGRPQEGLAVFEQAFKLDPSFNLTLQNLGVYYQSQKDILKAQEFFSKAKYYE